MVILGRVLFCSGSGFMVTLGGDLFCSGSGFMLILGRGLFCSRSGFMVTFTAGFVDEEDEYWMLIKNKKIQNIFDFVGGGGHRMWSRHHGNLHLKFRRGLAMTTNDDRGGEGGKKIPKSWCFDDVICFARLSLVFCLTAPTRVVKYKQSIMYASNTTSSSWRRNQFWKALMFI